MCRDPDDDLVLETAMLGQAKIVVSRDGDLKGDSDLISQMRANGIQVLSVNQILESLEGE